LVMIHANGGNRGVSNVNDVGKLFALLVPHLYRTRWRERPGVTVGLLRQPGL
jgi:hypothetical protein